MQNTEHISLFVVLMLMASAQVVFPQQPAFPGAEGGGMYTRGGRGGKVLEVTSLADDGSAGTFRWAVNQSGARTVVFRVSGTITLTSRLVITRDSLTIAGQTAPGDGICLRTNPLEVSANEVIIRYIRFRLGDESTGEYDAFSAYTNALTGYKRRIIIDHCSVSWSIDEALTSYGNDSLTIQWCIASESLYHSRHYKGNHGYGGIWGGRSRVSFHHNLVAHHTSRNPRLSGSSTTVPTYNVDLRNNVIYNWGFNSAYGGEGGAGNFVNNYYKPGPATKSTVRSRIFEPSDALGRWYINGNFVEGNPTVSADNWAGGVNPGVPVSDLNTIKATVPFPFMTVTTHSAQAAYDLVLRYAGASLPKRDTVDGRIVHEARTGTVTYGGHGDSSYAAMQKLDTSKVYGIIDSQTDVGGWPVLNSVVAPTDTDHDGMTDAWELTNGSNPNDAADRNSVDANGYTVLENYLNSIVGTNPGTTNVLETPSVPAEFSLEQNFPNPFSAEGGSAYGGNPMTSISYQVVGASAAKGPARDAAAVTSLSYVTLRVYDILGREIVTLENGFRQPGHYSVQWNGRNEHGEIVPSGVYLYQLRAGTNVSTKKMVVVR